MEREFSITDFPLNEEEVLLQSLMEAYVCSVSSAYFREMSDHQMFQVSELKFRSILSHIQSKALVS